MSDPYAPARVRRTNLILLACLALVALTGLGPYPAIPDAGAALEMRVRVAGLLAALVLGTAAWSLAQGRRGLAFERAALALPLLLVRSKWCLILAGVTLVSMATEAALGDHVDGRVPPHFRLRMLAGATAATLGWLLVLGLEGLAQATAPFFNPVAGAAYLVLAPTAAIFFLGSCYEWLQGLLESDELAAPQVGSLLALAGSILLYAAT